MKRLTRLLEQAGCGGRCASPAFSAKVGVFHGSARLDLLPTVHCKYTSEFCRLPATCASSIASAHFSYLQRKHFCIRKPWISIYKCFFANEQCSKCRFFLREGSTRRVCEAGVIVDRCAGRNECEDTGKLDGIFARASSIAASSLSETGIRIRSKT